MQSNTFLKPSTLPQNLRLSSCIFLETSNKWSKIAALENFYKCSDIFQD